jgi:hypothetical protein
MRDKKCMQKFWMGHLKGRGHSENLRVDGKIILERDGIK